MHNQRLRKFSEAVEGLCTLQHMILKELAHIDESNLLQTEILEFVSVGQMDIRIRLYSTFAKQTIRMLRVVKVQLKLAKTSAANTLTQIRGTLLKTKGLLETLTKEIAEERQRQLAVQESKSFFWRLMFPNGL
jgi:hypothetical protein